MKMTASSGDMPASINEIATSTGARPSPATQWTAIASVSLEEKVFRHSSSHFWRTSAGGGAPSSQDQSYSQNCAAAIKYIRLIRREKIKDSYWINYNLELVGDERIFIYIL